MALEEVKAFCLRQHSSSWTKLHLDGQCCPATSTSTSSLHHVCCCTPHHSHGDQSHLSCAEDALLYVPANIHPIDRANIISAVNWRDAQQRVIKSYRDWVRAVCIPYARKSRQYKTLEAKKRQLKANGLTKSSTGTRNPTNVLPQYASLGDTDEDAAGV